MGSYIGAIEAFDLSKGADWNLYVQRFEHFAKANKVEDDEKLHLFLAIIGASTYKLLASLSAPVEPGELTYKQVVEKLAAHFKPKPIVIAERFRFYKRAQRSGEKMADYLAELRRLAATCAFKEFLQKALRDRFVCGIANEAIQRRLLMESDLTLTKVVEMAQSMEAAAQDAKEIQSKDATNVQAVAPQRRPQLACHRCLGSGHAAEACRFKKTRCNNCRRLGHIARACKSGPLPRPADPGKSQRPVRRRQPQKTHQVYPRDESPPDTIDVLPVHAVGPSVPKSYNVPVEINGIPITMELDTGAGVSLVSETAWTNDLGKPQLQQTNIPLEGYPNRPLKVLGKCEGQVKVHGKEAVLPLMVVEGTGVSLLGRNWLERIPLNWMEIAKINGVIKSSSACEPQLQKLLDNYQEIFTAELGHCKGIKVHLHVREDATPKFYRPRPIPLALKSKVEADLDRMEKLESGDSRMGRSHCTCHES